MSAHIIDLSLMDHELASKKLTQLSMRLRGSSESIVLMGDVSGLDYEIACLRRHGISISFASSDAAPQDTPQD